jgi:diguanylate cyclase (GGDEF)-like protein
MLRPCDGVAVKPPDGGSIVSPGADFAQFPAGGPASQHVCGLCGMRVISVGGHLGPFVGGDAVLADEVLRDHARTCTSQLLGGFRALQEAIATSSDRVCGVLVIDIDGFKGFNCMYGHRTGDVALLEFASRVVETVGGDGEVFRIGGEEFLALLPNATLEVACAFAERVCERVRNEPFLPEGGASALTTSIGVACAPWHGATVEAVRSAADRAMYASKKSGRNRWTLATY